MVELWRWFINNEYAHFILAGTIVKMVASLESPTKDSSMTYRNFFRIANVIVFQWERINPKIENSPNFVDAVNKIPKVTQEITKEDIPNAKV